MKFKITIDTTDAKWASETSADECARNLAGEIISDMLKYHLPIEIEIIEKDETDTSNYAKGSL